MKPSHWISLATVIAAAAILYWLLIPSSPPPPVAVIATPRPERTERPFPPPVAPLPARAPAPSPAGVPQPSSPASAPGSMPSAKPPAAPAKPVPAPSSFEVREAMAMELNAVRQMFADFRTIAGENPVGTNAEIMKALTGDNKKGARLGPPEGQQLNGAGELLDRFGTPYFFHQLSKQEMEIRSAGTDRVMWTDDDIVTK